MTYFNHAFSKVFLGNGVTRDVGSTGAAESATNPYSTDGFITTSGSPSVELSRLITNGSRSSGYFGFYNKDTFLSIAEADLSGGGCCPLVLAGSALKAHDKQGPYHGGYLESNKSKYIKPNLISRYYRVDPCTPQQHIIHIGNTHYTGVAAGAVESIENLSATATAYTPSTTFTNVATTASAAGTGLTVDVEVDAAGTIVAITNIIINAPGSGYAVGETITIAGDLLGGATPAEDVTFDVLTVAVVGEASCNIPFYCDETYYLRLDVKGSPALRFANHNLYQTLQADGGCCDGPAPTEVDSTLIYIQWAQAIVENPYFVDFIQPVVFDESGDPWFHTAEQAVAESWPDTQIWANYVSPGHTVGDSGGIMLTGAYVDDTFTNCTFSVTDHYEKEPIKILASLVDYNGDPCVFEGVCVIEECPPLQGMGFGEQVVRDLIKSESYLQNFFASNDKRIQEITQGDDILASITRATMYTRYYIQHTVPRFNNPSSTFDNDQYMLEVITEGTNADFETFMSTWLAECGNNCTTLETFACDPCVPTPIPDPPQ